ncbi:alpha/beta fold hydrolase [Actinoplanes siamensis]|uniref:Alpha/beta hydrolase n=1 Tax=Actinoplanes siamensis TaxID=1223317 RepID=A0A919NCP5_9ACTN|nr:alpha/beta hydrolase [Actinoplanes siamensis]GIF08330.1 hypothetical protein Asi03nite_58680 [Actinoplanes siamensis]
MRGGTIPYDERSASGSPVFVLLHSLLLGPLTWAPVAGHLPETVLPSLIGVAEAEPPFWPFVVGRIRAAAPPDRPVVLVAHSNAGLLVPAVVDALRDQVAGCVFVDATLPARAGSTPTATPQRLAVLRSMAVGGRLPPWPDWWAEHEIAWFPDAVGRAAPRMPLSYYEQRMPAPAGWDERPCGYLLFGPPYDRQAARARERGWDVGHLPGHHLHQLADPAAVAAGILAMAARWFSHSRDLRDRF